MFNIFKKNTQQVTATPDVTPTTILQRMVVADYLKGIVTELANQSSQYGNKTAWTQELTAASRKVGVSAISECVRRANNALRAAGQDDTNSETIAEVTTELARVQSLTRDVFSVYSANLETAVNMGIRYHAWSKPLDSAAPHPAAYGLAVYGIKPMCIEYLGDGVEVADTTREADPVLSLVMHVIDTPEVKLLLAAYAAQQKALALSKPVVDKIEQVAQAAQKIAAAEAQAKVEQARAERAVKLTKAGF